MKYEISKIEDGIIRVFIKDNQEIEVEDLNEMSLTYKALMTTEKAPFLVVLGKFSSISNEARKILSEKSRSKIKLIEALVINSLAQRIIVNVILMINRKSYPTKGFNSESDALLWLKSELKKLETTSSANTMY